MIWGGDWRDLDLHEGCWEIKIMGCFRKRIIRALMGFKGMIYGRGMFDFF